ncbi:MAG: 1-acyl-sn-glycerol-3-phosphate acyltransferase [Sediminibacterium sp.]|nr:1-acyl-sn-glycerol-3-phosphate acyltransferase [Sediminibacterium sp.]MDP1810779.1 1-acyl-sn-glycerol-3-phosphate acyltransferase [Sediminibacterium sp.]
MRLVWSLFLRLMGWSLKGAFPYHIKKCVLIVGPHTSSWDFVIGIAFRSKLRFTHAKFLGKAELFKGPFGFIFRKLGGFPVERFEQHNMVAQAAALFENHNTFLLVLSPEGTRKKVGRLRTGFYHIAKKAGVPIVMAGMDYANKQVFFSDPFYPTDNEAADFQKIYQYYAPIKGKIPGQGMAHLLLPNP